MTPYGVKCARHVADDAKCSSALRSSTRASVLPGRHITTRRCEGNGSRFDAKPVHRIRRNAALRVEHRALRQCLAHLGLPPWPEPHRGLVGLVARVGSGVALRRLSGSRAARSPRTAPPSGGDGRRGLWAAQLRPTPPPRDPRASLTLELTVSSSQQVRAPLGVAAALGAPTLRAGRAAPSGARPSRDALRGDEQRAVSVRCRRARALGGGGVRA